MSEFILIAEKVIEHEKRAMSAIEIVDYAQKRKMFSDNISGKTPHQTMKAKLSVHIRKHGNNSIFVRTQKGKFYLRKLLTPSQQVYEAIPIKKPKPKENVLVFKSELLGTASRFQGISIYWKQKMQSLINSKHCFYVPRIEAEIDNSIKQVLTYVLITRSDDEVLAYNRGNYNRVEDFLRGAACIGFGGHVIEPDNDLINSDDMGIYNCVVRELTEELKLPDIDKRRILNREGINCVGVLNDDSSEAGQRHIAFIFKYQVSNHSYWNSPVRGEKSITKLRWFKTNANKVHIWEFEYWSQLCLARYFKKHVKPSSHFRINRVSKLRPPNIICILGQVGSGKSQVARILESEFNYQIVNTGRMVAELLDLPPVPTTPREEFQRRAWNFIKSKKGPKLLARELAEKTNEDSNLRTVIDGIRQYSTIEALKEAVAPRRLGFIYVHTLPSIAFELYGKRERDDMTIFDFLSLRNAEVERDVEDMIRISDVVLYNWFGETELKDTIKKFMKEILL